MAAPLTPAQRIVYAPLAWSLSFAGFSAPKIAEEIKRQYGVTVNEKTVDRLIAEQRAIFAQQNPGEVEQERLLHAARMARIWEHAWQKIGQEGLDPQVEAAFLRVARSAANDVARASGVFVERIDVHTKQEVLVRKYIGVDVSLV